MEVKKTEIESMLYRMGRLDRIQEDLKDVISGEGKYYTDDIRTKNGRYSSKKLDRMIHDLLVCLEDYKTYQHNREFKKKETHVRISKKEKAFYEAYFYLQLGFATYDNSIYEQKWREPATWGALLERIEKDAKYASLAEIDRSLLYYQLEIDAGMDDGFQGFFRHEYVPDGIFLDMSHSYDLVTEGTVTEIISEDDRKKAVKIMTSEQRANMKDPDKLAKKLGEECRKQEEIDDWFAERELTDEDWEAINALSWYEEQLEPAYLLGIPEPWERDDPTADQYGKNAGEWEKFFKDEDKYKKSCETVREFFCDNGAHGNIRSEAAHAVKLYMFKNGISKWNDDVFFTAYSYVKKALRTCGGPEQ